MSPDDPPDLDPALADAVRRAYVRPVDEVTARRHVSAIVAAAGEEPVARRPRQRRRVWRPVLAAGAATLLLPAGLAVAGVELPNAVERPYRTVGIKLPHQTGSAPNSAPATRPVTPRGPTTSTGAPRADDQRARRSRDGRGKPQRPERQGSPADRAGRQDKSRGWGVRGAPNLNGATGKSHKPASPQGQQGTDKMRPRRQQQTRPSSRRSSTPPGARKSPPGGR